MDYYCLVSFIILLVSCILLFTIATNIYVFVIAVVNGLVLGVSFSLAVMRRADEPTGYTPWYYGVL